MLDETGWADAMAHEFDEIDVKLITLLQDNGRIANTELAERVGLSPSGCLRRVQQLEQSGVIEGYHAALSPEHVELGLQVFLRVLLTRNDRDNLDRFSREVDSWPEVIACYAVTGECDYLLHVMTRDLKSYRDFMLNQLLVSPAVGSVNSSVVIDVNKKGYQVPLGHLGK